MKTLEEFGKEVDRSFKTGFEGVINSNLELGKFSEDILNEINRDASVSPDRAKDESDDNEER